MHQGRTGDGRKAYLKQYVEGLRGEHARREACRSSECAIAAEVFMNSAGYIVMVWPSSSTLREGRWSSASSRTISAL